MPLYTYDYNRDYFPSAPFVDIELNNYGKSAASILLSAQVDSGADVTAVPIGSLQRINAAYEETRVMRGISGNAEYVDLYWVSVHAAGETFYRKVIALAKGDEAIIGRDILKHLHVTLNGHASMTEILQE